MDAGSSSDGVKVKGYFQPQYNVVQTNNSYTNTFCFNRARIALVGNIPYDISYYFSFELSPFKTGHPYLLDVFATYKRFSFANISMGSFKSPFGLELSTPCHSLYTINRSKAVEELASPDRDYGVMISGGGDSSLFSYQIALMNGSGLLTNYTDGNIVKPFDVNNGKDIIGRIVLKPFDLLKFGASLRYGTSPAQTTGAIEEDKRIRFGGDAEFTIKNLIFQAEYIFARDNGSYSTGGGCGEPIVWHIGSKNRSGLMFQSVFKSKWNIWPVIKFETYDSDQEINNNSEFVTTYGFSYFINEWTRIQLNYLYKAEKGAETPNDQILFQVQVKF